MNLRPSENEYPPFFENYIAEVNEVDIISVMEKQKQEILNLFKIVKPEKETYSYAESKWSFREIFGHLVDSERVFGYRAFCISRGETAELPSFDENKYVFNSNYNKRELSEIIEEFSLLRDANLKFLKNLNEIEWKRIGTVNGNPVSVRAIAYIIAGHVRHHLKVLQKFYDLE